MKHNFIKYTILSAVVTITIILSGCSGSLKKQGEEILDMVKSEMKKIDSTQGTIQNIDNVVNPDDYYDYLLCSGGGYSLVAKQVESVTDIVEYVGVLDENYNWVVPLSENTPLNPNGGMVDVGGYIHFDSICSHLANVIYYSGDGIFTYAERTYGGYYRGSMLNLKDGTWFDPGFYNSNSLIFNNGILITADCDRFGEKHEYIKIISSLGDIKATDIYCRNALFIGQYSEGMFFAYDGFYDINENKVIDLSEYAGLIINNPKFVDGKCELIAENANGTKYKAVIDVNGSFISEFTQIDN